MLYASQDDLLARITEQELLQLTDDDRSGAIDATVVGDVLTEASAQVDSYCRNRYQIPLQPSTDATRITRDISIYLLYSRRPQKMSETVRQRYDDAMSFLKDLAAGKASLDQASGAPAPQTAANGAVKPRCTGERFTEHNLEGFI